MSQRTLIVGVGSESGDDQAGLIVAQRLARDLPSAAVRQVRSPAQLLDTLEGIEQLHIVDACQGAGAPGSILHYTWPLALLGKIRFAGTHDLDLASALRLAEELRLLPPRIEIWAIESSNSRTAFGAQASPEVEAAIGRLVVQLRGILGLESSIHA